MFDRLKNRLNTYYHLRKLSVGVGGLVVVYPTVVSLPEENDSL